MNKDINGPLKAIHGQCLNREYDLKEEITNAQEKYIKAKIELESLKARLDETENKRDDIEAFFEEQSD